MRRYLDTLMRTGQDGLGVSFDIDAAEALPSEEREETTDGPLIVLARHAGPGDSFLLVFPEGRNWPTCDGCTPSPG